MPKPGPKQLRLAANGHRLPNRIPVGTILTDVLKCRWKLGKSVGIGGFGEIYMASDDITKIPSPDSKYVIKVEPHSNGPLFSEMHFYYRVGKPEQIKEWMRKKKLTFLGMPAFIASGSHYFKNMKYRFLVLERFGEDLQKLLERNNRCFPLKTVYTLGVKIIDILEYIHSHGYIHADVKASNLLSGLGKRKQDEVHLIDFGLACRYISHNVHKEYKEDIRRAHDGTLEYTSRDAHIGAHSRRGDLEILGYNLLQWLSGHLPWEECLKDPDAVSIMKNAYMKDIPCLMEQCFQSVPRPYGLSEYLTYVANLKFEEEPDYELCRNILISAIKKYGLKYNGKLVYKVERNSFPIMSKKRPIMDGNKFGPLAKKRKTPDLPYKMPSENSGLSVSPPKKMRRVASAVPRLESKLPRTESVIYNNPTPAMLKVLQRRKELMLMQAANLKNGIVGKGKNSLHRMKRLSASSDEGLPLATKPVLHNPIRKQVVSKDFPKVKLKNSVSENKKRRVHRCKHLSGSSCEGGEKPVRSVLTVANKKQTLSKQNAFRKKKKPTLKAFKLKLRRTEARKIAFGL